VALGGGVVGDVAGYVASTVLRGIKYIQVPTTLLAQVDSSVGGKVGIDHPLGKNLVGAFHQPSAVYIDPLVLQTLPEREYRAGLAEVVKIAAALDVSFFRFLEKNAAQIRKRNARTLSRLIERSVRLKAAVVEKDEFETGLRKTLNLGHTIAHGLESARGYTLRHGEAVAIGLNAEAKIAVEMGVLSRHEQKRLLQLMKVLKLRTSFPRLRNKAKFFNALAVDKKGVGESARFVLLKRIGCCVIGVDVPTPFIGKVLL
jgi:3-dehydroquinate synthase